MGSFRSRASWATNYVVVLIVSWLLYSYWMFQQERSLPMISVEFTGKTTRGSGGNPSGRFILRNHRNQRIPWQMVYVDAPQVPDMRLIQLLSSNHELGILKPLGRTRFTALIPKTKGIPFRVEITYATLPTSWDIAKFKASHLFPLIERTWPSTNGWMTYTSQWFYAPIDYIRPY